MFRCSSTSTRSRPTLALFQPIMKKGIEVLRDKTINRSVEFTRAEREALGPHQPQSQQEVRALVHLFSEQQLLAGTPRSGSLPVTA